MVSLIHNHHYHVDSVHLKLKICCEFCDFKSSTRGNLKRHINSKHKQLKKFSCRHCSKKFCNSCESKKHEARQDRSKRVKCDCGKSFIQYNNNELNLTISTTKNISIFLVRSKWNIILTQFFSFKGAKYKLNDEFAHHSQVAPHLQRTKGWSL